MDFKELQDIWNNQNNDATFQINQRALHTTIKRKSKSVNHWINGLELMLIALNFIVSLIRLNAILPITSFTPGIILPIMYSAYAIYMLIRYKKRQKQEVHFEQTLLGELDKAIWQIDYLLKQGQNIVKWYAVPIALGIAISLLYDSKPIWAGIFLFVLPIVTYFGMRWEINKYWLPKKQHLTSLRETLLAQEGT